MSGVGQGGLRLRRKQTGRAYRYFDRSHLSCVGCCRRRQPVRRPRGRRHAAICVRKRRQSSRASREPRSGGTSTAVDKLLVLAAFEHAGAKETSGLRNRCGGGAAGPGAAFETEKIDFWPRSYLDYVILGRDRLDVSLRVGRGRKAGWARHTIIYESTAPKLRPSPPSTQATAL